MPRKYELVIDTKASTGSFVAPRFEKEVLNPLRVTFTDALPDCQVSLTIEARGEHWPVLVGLEVHALDGDSTAPISSAALRQVRIAELIQVATRHALHVGVDEAKAQLRARVSLHTRDEILSNEYRDEDYLPGAEFGSDGALKPPSDWLARAKAGGVTGPRTLRTVSALYRQALEYEVAPNPWVERWLDISSSTASYWIRTAREQGLLPRSTRKPRSDRKSDA